MSRREMFISIPSSPLMESIGWRNLCPYISRSNDQNFVARAWDCDIDRSLPCRPRWAPLRLSSWEGRAVPAVVTWEGARRIHLEKWAARQVRYFRRRNVVSGAGSTIDSVFAPPCNKNFHVRYYHRAVGTSRNTAGSINVNSILNNW